MGLYVPSGIPKFFSTCDAHWVWFWAIGIHSRKSGDVLRLSWRVVAYPCLIVCCGFPVGRAVGSQETSSFLGARLSFMWLIFSSHLARRSSIICDMVWQLLSFFLISLLEIFSSFTW